MDYSKNLIPQILPLLLNRAYDYCNTKDKIPSRHVRYFMTSSIETETKGKLNVPYYWAHWYHSGRGAINKNKLLIWYKNPKHDPRLPGNGYLFSGTKFRSLKPSEFKRDLAAGRLIVARGVGPTTVNYPFFANEAVNGRRGGMQGLDTELNQMMKAELDKYSRERMKKAGIYRVRIDVTI